MSKLLKILMPLLVVLASAGGAVYKFVLAKPAEAGPDPKVEGVLVPLEPEFMINLADGHFAKLSVALEVDRSDPALAGRGESEGGHDSGGLGKPVELPQGAAVRAIVTDRLTGLPMSDLLERRQRHQLLDRIRRQINRQTDTKVLRVLITDLTVD